MSKNFKSQFYEVYNTPIAQTPFIDILGLDRLTEDTEKVLTRLYVFPPAIHLVKKNVSSLSKLYNGHYIASTLFPYLTAILAVLTSLP